MIHRLISFLMIVSLLTGCAHQVPYIGVSPENPQFERGRPNRFLDFFGDFISKPLQLVFWTLKYGNHDISVGTEKELAAFLEHYQLKDVKVRLNQWAPHKDVYRAFTNKNIAWPYRLFFWIETLIASLIGRPFSGLVLSDYYDPAANTINIFSDEPSIALHEAGHALDFSRRRHKGTYTLVGAYIPGVSLVQESIATDEALTYLEDQKQYNELLRAYKILYPAYATYVSAFALGGPLVGLAGAVIFGQIAGRMTARDRKWQLEGEGVSFDEPVKKPETVVK